MLLAGGNLLLEPDPWASRHPHNPHLPPGRFLSSSEASSMRHGQPPVRSEIDCARSKIKHAHGGKCFREVQRSLFVVS
eukprot:5339553-Amphidinium_carterae.1